MTVYVCTLMAVRILYLATPSVKDSNAAKYEQTFVAFVTKMVCLWMKTKS